MSLLRLRPEHGGEGGGSPPPEDTSPTRAREEEVVRTSAAAPPSPPCSRPEQTPFDAPGSLSAQEMVLRVLRRGTRSTLAGISEATGLPADEVRRVLWMHLNANRLVWEVRLPAAFRLPHIPPGAPVLVGSAEFQRLEEPPPSDNEVANERREI